MSSIIDITTQEDFNKLTSSGISCITFTAKWCKPCQEMKQFFKEISKKYNKKMKFISVDVEKIDKNLIDFVTGLPTYLFFKNGECIDQLTGADVNDLASRSKIFVETKGKATYD